MGKCHSCGGHTVSSGFMDRGQQCVSCGRITAGRKRKTATGYGGYGS